VLPPSDQVLPRGLLQRQLLRRRGAQLPMPLRMLQVKKGSSQRLAVAAACDLLAG